MKSILRLVIYLISAIIFGWAVLVLYFSPLLLESLRKYGVLFYCVFFLLSICGGKLRSACRGLFLVSTLLIIYGWISLTPSTERNWAPEYRIMPSFEFDGDNVTIRNIRRFHYLSAKDSIPEYYDKTVKVSELSGLDILASYWAGKSIAHIMISFAFNETDFIAISIETRREANEEYSTVAGFFRNFELMYVVADERDLIGVRTTYRDPPESVYLLRTNMALSTARRFFLDYANAINQLSTNPEFYNTILTNCTSQVFFHTRVTENKLPYNWKLFLSGYVPDYLFDIHALAPGYALDQLLELGKVNERAVQAGNSDDFSIQIRKGVPKPVPVPD